METDEERRQRQRKFVEEKNRELAEWKRKQQAQTAAEGGAETKSLDDDAADTSAPSTPIQRKKSVPSSDDSSAALPAESFISPEKRRSKKLSSLQFPFFSSLWRQSPEVEARQQRRRKQRRMIQRSSTMTESSTAAAGVEQANEEEQSMGMILLGGGGGRKGAGIDSGVLVCDVVPATSASADSEPHSTPLRLSTQSSRALMIRPRAFLDSQDYLIGSIEPRPMTQDDESEHDMRSDSNVLAVTVGAGTAILKTELDAKGQMSLVYDSSVQTDFHRDLLAQAQAWSPSGNWFVTGGEDRTIRMWSYPSLKLIGVCAGKAGSTAPSSTFSSPSVAAAIPSTASMGDVSHRQPILSLHLNHDASRLASAAGDQFVKLWDTQMVEARAIEVESMIRRRAIEKAAEAEEQEDDETGDEEDDDEEDEPSLPSPLLCPLLHNLTIPLPRKGSILKFQAARFYGRTRLSLTPPTAAATKGKKGKAKEAEEGKDEDEVDEKGGDDDEAEYEDEAEADDAFPSPSGEEHLIVVVNVLQRGGGRGPSSYLIKYLCSNWSRVKQTCVGMAAVTCMSVSSGVHASALQQPLIALANTDGAVLVYRSDNLACIKRVQKCHELPATSLSFSPPFLQASPSSNSSSAASSSPRLLLSVSADKSIALIPIDSPQQSRRRWTIIMLIVACIVLILALLLGKEPWKLKQPERDL